MMSLTDRLVPYSLAILLVGAGAAVQAQQTQDSFGDAETRTALNAALAQNQRLQNEASSLKQAADAAAAKAAVLSLDAASLREENKELKLRLEAVGSAYDGKVIEKRLLDAINDLRLVRQENQELQHRLQGLAESASAYLAAKDEQKGEFRKSLEQILTDHSAAGSSDHVSSSARIETSRVVSVKPEEHLVVINAGKQTGLKVGTPLRIYRNDRPTASAVVVEVRSHIAGGLITKTEGDGFPQVGDTLRVDVRAQN